MQECVELYRVWIAFGVGFFIGGVVGVVVMCILNMARDQENGRVAEEYKRYLYGDRSTRVFSSLVTGLFSGRMLVRQGGHIANVARSNLLDFRYDCLKENSR